MKWYKKQLDQILKDAKTVPDDDKAEPAHANLHKNAKIIRKLPNHMEKRSRNKTDLP